MQKLMKLQCRVSVSEETPSMYRVDTYQQDGTPVTLKTSKFNVELNEEITSEKPTVDGWLFVLQEGKQGNRVSITLPGPSMQFGHAITVLEHNLMPRHVSVKDFQK